MKIRILNLAIQDIESGQHFYEEQQEGLGIYFLDSLFSDIDALLLYAGVHQQFFGYYRSLSRRFPYAIYYQLNDETIDVWRVLDCRQNLSQTANSLQQSLGQV